MPWPAASITSQPSTGARGAVPRRRERQDAPSARATATIARASEQLVRTDASTASMDEVTTNMAELTGRVTALAPLARMIAGSAGSPLAKAAALAYGMNKALWKRRPGGGWGGTLAPRGRGGRSPRPRGKPRPRAAARPLHGRA